MPPATIPASFAPAPALAAAAPTAFAPRASADVCAPRPASRQRLEPTMEMPLPDEDPDVLALVPWYVRVYRALRARLG
jgi:hypothetical protein